MSGNTATIALAIAALAIFPGETVLAQNTTANGAAAPGQTIDLPAALRKLRQERGIRYLLCEGGATLNDALLRAGLANELFLTLAPKLKGGAAVPTTVTGEGFPPGRFLALTLLSLYHDGDELYLRYRIHPKPEPFAS